MSLSQHDNAAFDRRNPRGWFFQFLLSISLPLLYPNNKKLFSIARFGNSTILILFFHGVNKYFLFRRFANILFSTDNNLYFTHWHPPSQISVSLSHILQYLVSVGKQGRRYHDSRIRMKLEWRYQNFDG
jgi:Cu/Ag efflux pump CusA